MPGEHFVGDARHRIRTLLGSCVSITLWHSKRRVGAMSHFLLTVGENEAVAHLSGRYCEGALDLMLTDLRKLGIKPEECQAKVFGGGMMFPDIERNDDKNIGRRNGETAERLLRMHNIPVVSESLFGIGHRHIIFNVKTGDVWVRVGPPGPRPGQALKERL
ncbi:chemoreceptor glutamine deamidase CheD [Pseudoduganella ginsengisoli]